MGASSSETLRAYWGWFMGFIIPITTDNNNNNITHYPRGRWIPGAPPTVNGDILTED